MPGTDGTAGGASWGPSQERRIAVFGATGTAGRAAARALRTAGLVPTAFGRNDPGLKDVPFIPVDVHDPAQLTAVLAAHRITDVVSCLASRSGAPTDAWAIDHAATVNLVHAAQAAGTAHFVLLSAICVQKPRLAFQYAKLAAEAALIGSGLTYSVIRPTAFFKSLSGQINRLRAGKPYLMFGDGRLTACKPISDADLGRFIASCVSDPARRNTVLPIGGPGPALTPQDMGAALFAALGLPPRYRRVPPRVIGTIAGTLALAGRLSPALAAKADLARIGHYYATESMLHWDARAGRYDADATPEFGSDTLAGHYRDLASGVATHERGDHSVF